MASSTLAQMSPVVTIKRSVRQPGQWQDFIEREQSTVDHLIKDSFAKLCSDLKENLTGKTTLMDPKIPTLESGLTSSLIESKFDPRQVSVEMIGRLAKKISFLLLNYNNSK
jgi:hypothetical protein